MKIAFRCFRSDRKSVLHFTMQHALNLSAALVVGNALCLGCSGLLGGEDQNHHGCNKGHHIVDLLAPVERRQERGIRNVGQRLKHRKEQCRTGDLQWLPLTEDHNRQGQEAHACNAHLEIPGGNGGDNIGKATDAAQHAGNQHTAPTHFIDVDAHGVRRLGMLAASGKPQTEPGAIQHHIGRNQDQCR